MASYSRPNILTVTRAGGEYPRPQIPGRVDGIAAVVSEANTDVEYNETDKEGFHAVRRRVVSLVTDGQYTGHQ